MNYNNYPQNQPAYGAQNRPIYGQMNGWTGRIRPVSSIEEVRAASIDFDGSVFFFPDLASKRIYTKQFNLDGTCSLNMYELKEIPVMSPEGGAAIDPTNFITRSEFEDAMGQIKQLLTPQPIPEVVEQAPVANTQTKSFMF